MKRYRILLTVLTLVFVLLGTVTAYADGNTTVSYLSPYATAGYGGGLLSGSAWGPDYAQYGGFFNVAPGYTHVIGVGAGAQNGTVDGVDVVMYAYQIEFDQSIAYGLPMLRMAFDGALVQYAMRFDFTYYGQSGNELAHVIWTGRDVLERGLFDQSTSFGTIFYPDFATNTVANYAFGGVTDGNYGLLTVPNFAAENAYAINVTITYPKQQPTFADDVDDIFDILNIPFDDDYHARDILGYYSLLSATQVFAPIVGVSIFLLVAAMLVKFML